MTIGIERNELFRIGYVAVVVLVLFRLQVMDIESLHQSLSRYVVPVVEEFCHLASEVLPFSGLSELLLYVLHLPSLHFLLFPSNARIWIQVGFVVVGVSGFLLAQGSFTSFDVHGSMCMYVHLLLYIFTIFTFP